MKMFIYLMIALILTGCFSSQEAMNLSNRETGRLSNGETVNLNEEFMLKKDKSAKVKDTNLQIKMLSNGQSIRESGGDAVFCKFETKFQSKTEERMLNVGESTAIENLKIKLTSVDTTADPKESDPWSSTSCKFIITKNTK